MQTYVFKVLTGRGIVLVPVTASGYFAAESAVRGMHPDGTILSWDRE